MLPRADLTIVPVGRVDAPGSLEATADPRQQAFQRSMAGLLGQSLQGDVLSKLTDGSYLVKVAGTAARMLLPPGAQVGSQLPLTLVALSPRPTFQISSQGPLAYPEAALAGQAPSARTTSHAAALLGKAPLVPASELPPIDPESTPATLSQAARVIGGVLAAARRAPNPPGAISAPAPLAQSPAQAPEAMAAALQNAVAHSGLFYESHLAEWAEGKRSLAELMREPQMQRFASLTGETQPRAPLPTDPPTAQFINLQLQTQEQARLAWQGQLWPGQDMQWQIERDAPERRPGQQEPAPAWRSTLRLRFEQLGDIRASIVMSGAQIHIELDAGSSEVSALLRAHAGKLDLAMQAAGTALSSLTMRADQGDMHD